MFEFEDVNTEKRKEIFKNITDEDCINLKKQIDKSLSIHKQDLMLGVCKEFELIGGTRDGWIIYPKCKLGRPNITEKWMSVFLTITLGEPYEEACYMWSESKQTFEFNGEYRTTVKHDFKDI